MFYVTTRIPNAEGVRDGEIRCIWYCDTLVFIDVIEIPPPVKVTLYVEDLGLDVNEPKVMGLFPEPGTLPHIIATGNYAIEGKLETVDGDIVITNVTVSCHDPTAS